MKSMLAQACPPAPLTPASTQRTSGVWGAALLLACPLMHLFQGHGGHSKPDSHGPRPR
ncbi:MAG: DUF2933 domain-containing protein [Rubrivivax sp.]